MNGTTLIQHVSTTSSISEITKTALTTTAISAGVAFFGGFKVAQIAVTNILNKASPATEQYPQKQAGNDMRTIRSTSTRLLANAAGLALGYCAVSIAIPFLWLPALIGTGAAIVSIAERNIVGSEHTHQFINQFDAGGMTNYLLENLSTI